MGDYDGIKTFVIGLIIVVGTIGVLSWITIVPTGSVGIKKQFGVAVNTVNQGLNFNVPFIESIEVMNIQKQKIEVTADSGTKDLQSINTKIALSYHIKQAEAIALYSEIGSNYASVIINPAIEEATKATTARFTASECITNREEVKSVLTQELKDRIEKYYLVVDEVSIIDFGFSAEFNKAIEEKVTKEQDVLKEKQELEKIKITSEQQVVNAQAEATARQMRASSEANATIMKAQAEAEAQRLQQVSLNEDLLRLYYINRWNGVLPTVVSDGTGLLMNLTR